ncbi:hypothetical protein BBI01_01285 [Chryseobacterium artocarpi]|uniref:Lipoprotein n=2 Tax=Chryseobacterium artocarpi TaxID=1414727 RepID=A0A1B8ZZV8_9FLAO|nr:hypothetical protein BBI01_01285 [Chryseobacterium artocarpi]
MKKSTIISLVMILTSIGTLSSCREDEMDQMEKTQPPLIEKNNKNMSMRNIQDTLTVSTNSNANDNETSQEDPPPKDRGQW